MAKRKKANNTTSFSESIGFSKVFHNEKLNFMTGLASLIIAIYMTMAFISFFTTGNADQSLIEVPRAGEIMNEKREFMNNCGSIGAYTAYYFVKRCFGIAAFLIPTFLIMISLKMMRVYIINLSKCDTCQIHYAIVSKQQFQHRRRPWPIHCKMDRKPCRIARTDCTAVSCGCRFPHIYQYRNDICYKKNAQSCKIFH